MIRTRSEVGQRGAAAAHVAAAQNYMSDPNVQPTPPPRPPFQFSLRTLLFLFVVLGSSLAVFGGWGVVVFGLVVGLAISIQVVRPLEMAGISRTGRFHPPVGGVLLLLGTYGVELAAQHRRAGRVAAFGRHAADRCGAEQEEVTGSGRAAGKLKSPLGVRLSDRLLFLLLVLLVLFRRVGNPRELFCLNVFKELRLALVAEVDFLDGVRSFAWHSHHAREWKMIA